MQDTPTQRWVTKLKESYPQLPDNLTLEVEKSRLQRLSRWFAHVEELRQTYDTMEKADLPPELSEVSGKRQVIPALMSLDAMTDDEQRAWHELFVCLSAYMADRAYRYWRTHASSGSSVSLEDVLNFLPIVFLYVLSSYKEYPKHKRAEHEDDFSASSDGRVRLITWVHTDARRHINAYLQQHAYTVPQGSGHIHRLRKSVLALQAKMYAKNGHVPSKSQITEAMSSSRYAKSMTASTFADHVSDAMNREYTVSLTEPRGEAGWSYEDTITTTSVDVEQGIYDPCTYLEKRVDSTPFLRDAVHKVLYTDEPLNYHELVFFG